MIFWVASWLGKNTSGLREASVSLGIMGDYLMPLSNPTIPQSCDVRGVSGRGVLNYAHPWLRRYASLSDMCSFSREGARIPSVILPLTALCVCVCVCVCLVCVGVCVHTFGYKFSFTQNFSLNFSKHDTNFHPIYYLIPFFIPYITWSHFWPQTSLT